MNKLSALTKLRDEIKSYYIKEISNGYFPVHEIDHLLEGNNLRDYDCRGVHINALASAIEELEAEEVAYSLLLRIAANGDLQQGRIG